MRFQRILVHTNVHFCSHVVLACSAASVTPKADSLQAILMTAAPSLKLDVCQRVGMELPASTEVGLPGGLRSRLWVAPPPCWQYGVWPGVQAAVTKYHRLGGLYNKMYFLTVLRLEVWHEGVSVVGFRGELSSWLVDGSFLTWPFFSVYAKAMAVRGGGLSRLGSLLIRILILWDQGPTL